MISKEAPVTPPALDRRMFGPFSILDIDWFLFVHSYDYGRDLSCLNQSRSQSSIA
jgi:hypothetical protein